MFYILNYYYKNIWFKVMQKESEFDKAIKKYIVDLVKIVFDKNIKGFGSKASMILLLAHDNPAGSKGALALLLVMTVASSAIIFQEL